MREKELRLSLICYGGISLAVYMHGITKEIWNVTRASRAFHDGHDIAGLPTTYADIFRDIKERTGLHLRVVTDIISGASAGGINAIFLAQAIETGQSLEPLTELWLENADVEKLIAPDARPAARFTKFWAAPIIWAATRKQDDAIERTVSEQTQEEVRQKLSHFVRSRWFRPPFGGDIFTSMLIEALDNMEKGPTGPPLLPPDYPLDLMVTVTDFAGHPMTLRLHSPETVTEMEHRMILHFRSKNRPKAPPIASVGSASVHPESGKWADPADLVFAGRATASFPGAFPPFTVKELDRLLKDQGKQWQGREAFLRRIFPRHMPLERAENASLIDGSVLNNAPFSPAISALKNRPARRMIDRRFVYIDPKPLGSAGRPMRQMETAEGNISSPMGLPGFFRTIFGAISDIPREQPIRDNLEAIETRSRTIRHMRRIINAMWDEIEKETDASFGTTLFLDRPTPARLNAWEKSTRKRAAKRAGFSYTPYMMVRLSSVIEEIGGTLCRIENRGTGTAHSHFQRLLWEYARQHGLDKVPPDRVGSLPDNIEAFCTKHDLGFRIRRLRFMARQMTQIMGNIDTALDSPASYMHKAIYDSLTLYQQCEASDYYPEDFLLNQDIFLPVITATLQAMERIRNLPEKDRAAEEILACALDSLPKDEKRKMLLAYLGFPFFDIATLPLLQGEGLDEYDPIKVDRISPDDCTSLRQNATEPVLKGLEFHSFGAFFSRAYRENDYLWGRIHGAERMIDIITSTFIDDANLPMNIIKGYKKQIFTAILSEEKGRLPLASDLMKDLQAEIALM